MIDFIQCYGCKHYDDTVGYCNAEKYCTYDVAEILMNFFPEAPCNYNDMDEKTNCEFCAECCGKTSVIECWKYAIDNEWWKVERKTCEGCKHIVTIGDVQVCWLPFNLKGGDCHTVSKVTNESNRCEYYDI